MAKKKKDEQGNLFVNIKEGCHCITLANRTIHCPHGVAYVTPDEKARIEAMGLIK